MDFAQRLFDHLPLLLVVTPLLGIFSLSLSRWTNSANVKKLLFVNLSLSTSLLVLLLISFDSGPERLRLTDADSFQAVSQITMSLETGDAVTKTIALGLFAVDGLSLPMLCFAVLFPWLVYFSNELTTPRLLLLAQSLAVAMVTTLDLKLFVPGLFLLHLLIAAIDSQSLSAGNWKSTRKQQRLLVLSHCLIAAGLFALWQSSARFLYEENSLASLENLRTMLLRIEILRDDDPAAAGMLSLSATPALWLIVVGVLLRMPLFPFQRPAQQARQAGGIAQRTLHWLQGPVLGSLLLLRVWQLVPETTSSILSLLQPLAVLGVVWFAARAGSQRDQFSDAPTSETTQLLLGTQLVFVGLSTPNPLSLGGALLLLVLIPLQEKRTGSSSAGTLAVRFPLLVGLVLLLLGLFQGAGSGERGFGALILVLFGLGMFLSRGLKPTTREQTSLFRDVPQFPTPLTHESPQWIIAKAEKTPNRNDHRSGKNMTVAALVWIACLLFPGQFWSRVRWDVQKIEFPRAAAAFSNLEKADAPPALAESEE